MSTFATFRFLCVDLMCLLLNYFTRLRRRRRSLGQGTIVGQKDIHRGQELQIGGKERRLQQRAQFESNNQEDKRCYQRQPSMLQAPMSRAVVVAAEALVALFFYWQRFLLCRPQPVVT